MSDVDAARRVRAPVIILGAPRSGTTLLADVLDAHPSVAVLNEPRLIWRFGNDRRSDELRPAQATPAIVAHIHRSFAATLDQRGARFLVEKTPANAVRPRFVDAVFPDARFVHITRDGWGAIPSLRSFWQRRAGGMDVKQLGKLRRRLREAHVSQLPHYARELVARASLGSGSARTPLYGPRLAGLQAMVDELGHLEAAAQQWRTCVDQTTTFGRGLDPGRYLEVRLESFDAGRLAEIVDFCGLPAAGEVGERFDQRYDPALATARSPLTDAEIATVAPYVVAANAMLGYPAGYPGDGAPPGGL